MCREPGLVPPNKDEAKDKELIRASCIRHVDAGHNHFLQKCEDMMTILSEAADNESYPETV